MKLIGIIGMSGSGKTTLSRMLERDNNTAVIHLDEILNMREIKEKMPNGLVDKNIYSNAEGEEIMLMDKRIRKIRDRIIENKLLNKLYFKISHLIKENLLKKAVNRKIEEGKETIILDGDTLGNFKIYSKLDYLIQINAPFEVRKKRVIKRKDVSYDKETMVERDIKFRQAQKHIKISSKQVDEQISNIGNKEDLQKTADRIYSEQIKNRNRIHNDESMQEKYGGYKTRPLKRSSFIEVNEKQRDDQRDDQSK